MKGGIKNCKMCGKGIKTFLRCIGNKKGHIDSDEGIFFEEGGWFCNECWTEVIGEKVNKPFKIIKKKLPHKKLSVFRVQDKIDVFEEPICIIEVKENIKRVFNDKPLTRPLAVLNRSCEFKKRYDMAFDIINEDKIKERKREYNKEYNNKPEVKKRSKEYYQRPGVKAKKKEYSKKYSQKPGIKEKRREYSKKYSQKPEIITKRREYEKEYYQKQEVKERRKKLAKENYLRKKQKI